MFKNLLIFFSSLCLSFFPVFLIAQNRSTGKKLIEFGWDYPSVSFLVKNIAEMEKTPFDGVCFSFGSDIYNAFDTTQYDDSKFEYQNIKKIPWRKFTDNFLIVRGAAYSGARWLDDNSWTKISRNLKKLSKSLATPEIKGIGFDPEYYFKDSTLNPWVYKPAYYNNLSYQQVGSYVRKRGKQFMQALQTYKPDVKVMAFWLLELVYFHALSAPIENTHMALYPFFVEGMLEGQNRYSEIIDGNEASYTYQNFLPFVQVGHLIRDKQSELVDKNLQSKFKAVSLAQAVYLDLLYAKIPKFDKGFNQEIKNQWLKDNLYFAFKTTDEYVWFYNERVNWWKNDVDPGVKETLLEVKDRIKYEMSNDRAKITGQSSIIDFRKKEPVKYQAFTYDYIKAKKLLRIKLLKDDISSVQVYRNSSLIYNSNNPQTELNISLHGKYKANGNLIIVAKDSKGISAVSFVN